VITQQVQRWRGGRSSYRPAGEVLDPKQYEVAPILDDTTAKSFVVEHHYSGTYPAARVRFGLHKGPDLVGVAVFSMPMQSSVLDLLPCPRIEAVELGRFVLLDHVPSNGESWFLARCFERLQADGFAGVVSFADPVPRRAADGTQVSPGHVGTIYQASNATYTGRSTPRTLCVLPDGTVISDRALSKIRGREKGWRYAVDQLIHQGARHPRQGEDLTTWLREVKAKIGRRSRHHGNHRYLWGLDRTVKRTLGAHLQARGVPILPYPKVSGHGPRSIQ
jgi:hypothetical protein